MTNKVLATGAQHTDGLVVDVISDLICPWCFVASVALIELHRSWENH